MRDFKRFLLEKDTPKGKNRTVNIKSSTHEFYKKTSSFYGVHISTIINNILEDWIDLNKSEIIDDIKTNL